MTHIWDYPETILHKAKDLFKDYDQALLATVWCLQEKDGKSPREIGIELKISAYRVRGLYNRADYLRLEDWEFREKTNELLNE